MDYTMKPDQLVFFWIHEYNERNVMMIGSWEMVPASAGIADCSGRKEAPFTRTYTNGLLWIWNLWMCLAIIDKDLQKAGHTLRTISRMVQVKFVSLSTRTSITREWTIKAECKEEDRDKLVLLFALSQILSRLSRHIMVRSLRFRVLLTIQPDALRILCLPSNEKAFSVQLMRRIRECQMWRTLR